MIQAAPPVARAKMNIDAITSIRKWWADPYTVKVVSTASRKPPIPVTLAVGSTATIPKIGIR